MQKIYNGKALMTNHSKFQIGKNRYTCYFAVAAWLSNFCHELAFLCEWWRPIRLFL